MENALKFVLLGVALIIVVALVGYGFSITEVGQNLLNGGMSSLSATVGTMSDMDKQLYDNTTVTGREVITAIKKFNEGGCVVMVVTKQGGAVLYSGDLARWKISDSEVGTGANANCADSLKSIADTLNTLEGWPKTLTGTYGTSNKTTTNALAVKSDGTVIEQNTPIQIKKIEENQTAFKTASGSAVTSWYRTSTWAGEKEMDGTYDGTFSSTDPDYIPGDASFKATLQKNENSEVKCVTFVQK